MNLSKIFLFQNEKREYGNKKEHDKKAGKTQGIAGFLSCPYIYEKKYKTESYTVFQKNYNTRNGRSSIINS